jgi:ribosomal protein S28E/S33
MSDRLKAAQKHLAARVMGRPGVTGTAIGEKNGKACLKVYLSERDAGRSIPRSVWGVPVVVEVTGPIRPL